MASAASCLRAKEMNAHPLPKLTCTAVSEENRAHIEAYVGDGTHGRKTVDKLLEENARGDATDKDLCVLRIDRSPLGVELVDDDVVSLAFVAGALVGEQNELGFVANTILCVSTGQTDCGDVR